MDDPTMNDGFRQRYLDALKFLQQTQAPMGPEPVEPTAPKETFLQNAAGPMAAVLGNIRPARLPGAGHQAANILSALAQIYGGAQQNMLEQKRKDYSTQAAQYRADMAERRKQQMAGPEALRQRVATDMLAPPKTTSAARTFRLTKEQAKAMGPEYDTETEYPLAVFREALLRTRPQKASSYDIGFDPHVVADKIVRGEAPPVSSGYSRGQWGKIITAMQDVAPGFNVARANVVWEATKKHVSALNSRQQTQLHTSAEAVQNALPEMKRLSDELSTLVPRGQIVPINKLAVGATQNFGVNGQKAQDVAQQLLTMMNTIEPELGNIYRAGGVPTDQAMDLVHKTFNMSLSASALSAAIDTESWMLNVRMNAIYNSKAVVPGGGPNIYEQAPPASPSSPDSVDVGALKGNAEGTAKLQEILKSFGKKTREVISR